MWSVVGGESGIAGPGCKTKPVSTPVRGKGGIAGPGYETKSVSTPVRGTGVHVHVLRSLYPGHVNCMDTTTYIDRLLFFKTKHRGILHVSVYIY